MATGISQHQIADAERVKNTKIKIERSDKAEEERFQRISKISPETLTQMVLSVEEALSSHSPFPESTLLLAFRAEPERVKKALSECTKKVFTAPIQKEKYQWFKQYVFSSLVWFKKTENGEYLYEEMMNITDSKQKEIIQNMNNVYSHLTTHSKWNEVVSIENKTVISRQDDEAVGLLQEAGIRDILEVKDSSDDDQDDDDFDDIADLKNYIDTNLAVNLLMTTAKKIDGEFQREMDTILSRHGDFKKGPMKQVDRAISKMENDFMDEEYPKAAKLLDIVCCSASYSTVDQLLDGYNAFMDHIESGLSSMTLAGINNGFLDENDGGFRDITVDVVYRSTLLPEVRMVCEVQFILHQYLYEKKRVHNLYSIARERMHFDMVARELSHFPNDDSQHHKPLKDLSFEPILNVRDDVDLQVPGDYKIKKCSIDSDLGLLGMSESRSNTFFCVDIASKQLVFKHSAFGRYSHHWLTIYEQKYLSLQTTKNTISMFRVGDDHNFVEDEPMKITLSDDDEINYIEYDHSFDHVYIVRNQSILEKRSVIDSNSVSVSIELETKITSSGLKRLSLSNDGKCCVIGVPNSDFFYVIDLETQQQFKLIPQKMKEPSCDHCFINGDSNLVAIGGHKGDGVEIWSVADKKMVHHIIDREHDNHHVKGTYSANGILAVGYAVRDHNVEVGLQNHVQLYDVSSWSMIYRYSLEMRPYFLFLTQDNRYLAAGGSEGEKCVVLRIQ